MVSGSSVRVLHRLPKTWSRLATSSIWSLATASRSRALSALDVCTHLFGMAVVYGNEVLTDAEWALLHPLIEACRPRGKTPPQHLRRTVTAILWRHTNGAKWRTIPSELGPWWMAAKTFIRWARLGVWERLLDLAQQRGVALGMTFLDGTNIRAHAKAVGASKKGIWSTAGRA